MRPTRTTLRFSSHILALAAITFLPGSLAAADAAESAGETHDLTLILTGHLGRAFTPVGEDPQVQREEATGKLTDAIDRLLDAHPNALLIDVGGSTVSDINRETEYFSPQWRWFEEKGYDAVHITAKDYANYGAAGLGFSYADPDRWPMYLGNLDAAGRRYEPFDLNDDKSVDLGASQTVTLIAAADKSRLSGMPLALESAAYRNPEDILKEAVAEVDPGQPVLVLSEFPPRQNAHIAQRYPAVTAVIESNNPTGEARVANGALLLPFPAGHQVVTAHLKIGADGAVESHEISAEPWIDEEAFAALRVPNRGILGVSVRPPEVITSRFGVQSDALGIDVLRGTPFPDLTDRENVYVYSFEMDGQRYRLYRVYFLVNDGWIGFDAMVVMNQDHTIRMIETNTPTYPSGRIDTLLGQVLAGFYDKAPENWTIPAELVAGYEQQAEAIVDLLRRTIEMDRRVAAELTLPAE
ncbi:MAG: hypothetical protein RLY93_16075 [Sumerlaeia bacterium]